MRSGGAAHNHLEAPRSINLAMPKSCIQVTSHRSLVTPNLIPSYSSLLSNFRCTGSDDISGTRPTLLTPTEKFSKNQKTVQYSENFFHFWKFVHYTEQFGFQDMPAERML